MFLLEGHEFGLFDTSAYLLFTSEYKLNDFLKHMELYVLMKHY